MYKKVLQALCLLSLPFLGGAQDASPIDSAEVEISIDDDDMLPDSAPLSPEPVTIGHPADSLYKGSWSHVKVNPYDTSMYRKPDTTFIDLSGYVHPNQNVITSAFGFRRWRFHYGTDTRLRVGDSVRCAFSGQVRISMRGRAYGNFIVVRHNNGLETTYAHLKKPLVMLNQYVMAGQVIGLGGNTGRSTGPHLHFEMRYLGEPMNPAAIIDFSRGEPFCDTLKVCSATFDYITEIRKVRVWIVRSGDSLWKISRRTGVSIARLCQLNKISRKTVIRPGRRIRYT